jgi:hypothetical protein
MLGDKSFIFLLEPLTEFPQTSAMKSTMPFIYTLNIVLIYLRGGVIDSLQHMNRKRIRPVRSTPVTII